MTYFSAYTNFKKDLFRCILCWDAVMVWYKVWYGMVWYDMIWHTLFKSKKHASPNNTQLVSMEGIFEQIWKETRTNNTKLIIW